MLFPSSMCPVIAPLQRDEVHQVAFRRGHVVWEEVDQRVKQLSSLGICVVNVWKSWGRKERESQSSQSQTLSLAGNCPFRINVNSFLPLPPLTRLPALRPTTVSTYTEIMSPQASTAIKMPQKVINKCLSSSLTALKKQGKQEFSGDCSDVPENKIRVAIFIWCLISSVLRLSSLSSLP